jgi:hypothetical protein
MSSYNQEGGFMDLTKVQVRDTVVFRSGDETTVIEKQIEDNGRVTFLLKGKGWQNYDKDGSWSNKVLPYDIVEVKAFL